MIAQLYLFSEENIKESITALKKKYYKESIYFNKENKAKFLDTISSLILKEKNSGLQKQLLRDLFQMSLEILLLHKKDFSAFFENFFMTHFSLMENKNEDLLEEIFQKLLTLNQSCPPQAYLLYINLLQKVLRLLKKDN